MYVVCNEDKRNQFIEWNIWKNLHATRFIFHNFTKFQRERRV